MTESWFFSSFRWFFMTVCTALTGILCIFVVSLLEFVSYFNDKDGGYILQAYHSKFNSFLSILGLFSWLMAYQSSWVISCKSHSCNRTVVVLLTLTHSWEGNKVVHAFPKNISLKVIVVTWTHLLHSPVGWSCRIHWLHLFKWEEPPPPECLGYDTKQSWSSWVGL